MSRKQATSSAARGALAMLMGAASGRARTTGGGGGAIPTVDEHPRLISLAEAERIYGIRRQTWEFWGSILKGVPRSTRYDRELAQCLVRVGRQWRVDSRELDRVLADRLACPHRRPRVVPA